nr:phospholipase A1-II 4-like [Ipomoea batatas]
MDEGRITGERQWARKNGESDGSEDEDDSTLWIPISAAISFTTQPWFVAPSVEAFIADPASKNIGLPRYERRNLLANTGLVKGNPFRYEVTKYFYAASGYPIGATGYNVTPVRRDAVLKESNWNGYVAVATDEGKVALGRRDILIVWRGTMRPLEWVTNFTFLFVKAPLIFGQDSDPQVHRGWYEMYTAINQDSVLNEKSARDQLTSKTKTDDEVRGEGYQNSESSVKLLVEGEGGYGLSRLREPHVQKETDVANNEKNQGKLNNNPLARRSQLPQHPGTKLLNKMVHHSVIRIPVAKCMSPAVALTSKIPSSIVREEVARLVELYKDEEISITVTGHSLGSSMATLNATDLAVNPFKPDIPVTAFLGLRITDVNDIVTKIPPFGWPVGGELLPVIPYQDVGEGLIIESKKSDYLKPELSSLGSHDLMLYMHAIDGFQGPQGGIEPQGDFDIAKINKFQDALKDEYNIPVAWLTIKDKGMVQQEDGSYTLDDHEGDETF